MTQISIFFHRILCECVLPCTENMSEKVLLFLVVFEVADRYDAGSIPFINATKDRVALSKVSKRNARRSYVEN